MNNMHCLVSRIKRVMISVEPETSPRGYKTFFTLNSAEHEIFSANKYENEYLAFSYLSAENCSCLAMISKTEFAIVSNFRFISMKKKNHAHMGRA